MIKPKCVVDSYKFHGRLKTSWAARGKRGLIFIFFLGGGIAAAGDVICLPWWELTGLLPVLQFLSLCQIQQPPGLIFAGMSNIGGSQREKADYGMVSGHVFSGPLAPCGGKSGSVRDP